MTYSLFQRFSDVLTSPSAPQVRDPRLVIESLDGVNVYYAPFEYVNPDARVVLVGITPGPTQMFNANKEARRALLAGDTAATVLRAAKQTAAFSGEPMRGNLVRQLNHWGFHKWLGLPDCGDLFASASNLVQTTSLLRYPVFVNGDDYRGAPDMIKHKLLRAYLHDHFCEEVKQLPDAIYIPLGPQVQKVLDRLALDGRLNGDRIVRGLLHPSGNNTYRINYLTGDRSGPIPHATNPMPYIQGRATFVQRYLGSAGLN